MTHTNNYNNGLCEIDVTYNNLYSAFMLGDCKAIERCCNNSSNLRIPQFHEKANMEMKRLYALIGINTINITSSIDKLPNDILRVYAQACLNVLFNIKMQHIKSISCSKAYQMFRQPSQYKKN